MPVTRGGRPSYEHPEPVGAPVVTAEMSSLSQEKRGGFRPNAKSPFPKGGKKRINQRLSI